jgi:hypothetical protein
MDFPLICHEIWLFLIIDLATKKILRWTFQKKADNEKHCTITFYDVIQTLHRARTSSSFFTKRKALNEPQETLI